MNDDLFPNTSSSFDDDLFPDAKNEFTSFLSPAEEENNIFQQQEPPPSNQQQQQSQQIANGNGGSNTSTPSPQPFLQPTSNNARNATPSPQPPLQNVIAQQQQQQRQNNVISHQQQSSVDDSTQDDLFPDSKNDFTSFLTPSAATEEQNGFKQMNQQFANVNLQHQSPSPQAFQNAHVQPVLLSVPQHQQHQQHQQKRESPSHWSSISQDNGSMMNEVPLHQHQQNNHSWNPSPQPTWSPASSQSGNSSNTSSPSNQWQQQHHHQQQNNQSWNPSPQPETNQFVPQQNWQQPPTTTNNWQQPSPSPTNWQQPPQQTGQNERWQTVSPQIPNNKWRPQSQQMNNWQSSQGWNQQNQFHQENDFFSHDLNGPSHQNHPQRFSQQQQYQVQPRPRLPIFSFGFGKTVFIPMNTTQVQVSTGFNILAAQKPDMVSSLDITDTISKSNYLDFTFNNLLSNSSREKWELLQVVQLIARNGAQLPVLIDQICRLLLSNASPQVESRSFQVMYSEAAIIPYLENGDVRGAIDEAMNRGMYGIAILLSQGWPELGLHEQVLESVAFSASPLLGSLLGYKTINSDWRRTVAMILKNNSKAKGISVIQALGDKLWKDDKNVFSAHLCYLCCGLLAEKNEVLLQRAILLGGDHKRNLRGFFDKETIERSMFISDLTNSPKFQPFKLVYALYLVNYCGNYDLAQKYLASIQPKMLFNPQFQYQHELLSHRLKCITNKSGGFFSNHGRSSSVTGWLFKSFENLIHGDEASPTSPVSDQQQKQNTQFTPPTPQTVHEPSPPMQQEQPRIQQQMQPPQENTQRQQQNSQQQKDDKKGGWFGGLFSGGKKKTNEISFGKDLEMEFCDKRKRWVPKGQAGKVTEQELQEEREKNAPPDMSMMSGNFLTQSQPSIAQRGGYIDLFNSNSASSATPPMGMSAGMGMSKIRSSPNLQARPPSAQPQMAFFVPQPQTGMPNGSVSEPASPAHSNLPPTNFNFQPQFQ